MELISPNLGLVFWMLISFGVLFLLLKKFAFPVIFKMLKDRETAINNALQSAETAREELANLQVNNEKLLAEARNQRDEILKQTEIMRKEMLVRSQDDAKKEYEQMIEKARKAIANEKEAAIVEIKNDMANLAISIAEKILERELQNKSVDNTLIEKAIKEL